MSECHELLILALHRHRDAYQKCMDTHSGVYIQRYVTNYASWPLGSYVDAYTIRDHTGILHSTVYDLYRPQAIAAALMAHAPDDYGYAIAAVRDIETIVEMLSGARPMRSSIHPTTPRPATRHDLRAELAMALFRA